jgi:hypothetical protein
MTTDIALPFGRYANQPLADVPSSYLSWLLAEAKLSTGLRAAVAAELGRRQLQPQPARQVAPEPSCATCGPSAGLSYRWGEDSLGRRYIRRSCARCDRYLGAAPQVEPFVTRANAAASAAPVVDVLIAADDENLVLHSDGVVVDFATPADERRATPALRAALRQCRHTFAGMIGRNRERSTESP